MFNPLKRVFTPRSYENTETIRSDEKTNMVCEKELQNFEKAPFCAFSYLFRRLLLLFWET